MKQAAAPRLATSTQPGAAALDWADLTSVFYPTIRPSVRPPTMCQCLEAFFLIGGMIF